MSTGVYKRNPISDSTRLKMSLARIGKPSPKKGKKYPNVSNENHHFWKGDKVGYKCLHDWVTNHKGRPTKCSNPECVYPRLNARNVMMLKPSRFEWASKTHRAKRDLDDYISLCVPCHRSFDSGSLKLIIDENEPTDDNPLLSAESEVQEP